MHNNFHSQVGLKMYFDYLDVILRVGKVDAIKVTPLTYEVAMRL